MPCRLSLFILIYKFYALMYQSRHAIDNACENSFAVDSST